MLRQHEKFNQAACDSSVSFVFLFVFLSVFVFVFVLYMFLVACRYDASGAGSETFTIEDRRDYMLLHVVRAKLADGFNFADLHKTLGPCKHPNLNCAQALQDLVSKGFLRLTKERRNTAVRYQDYLRPQMKETMG